MCAIKLAIFIVIFIKKRNNKFLTVLSFGVIGTILYKSGWLLISLGYILIVLPTDIESELQGYEITDFDFVLNENKNSYELELYHGKAIRIKIPNEYNGKSVKIIGGSAFSYASRDWKWGSQIKSIDIPSSVIKIEGFAFGENDLKKLKLPNNLEYIGRDAFIENRLKSVIIPDKVIFIGEGAFKGNKLKKVIIPNSVKFIGKNAFSENEGLIIYGKLGSEAERYVKEEKIKFKELK